MRAGKTKMAIGTFTVYLKAPNKPLLFSSATVTNRSQFLSQFFLVTQGKQKRFGLLQRNGKIRDKTYVFLIRIPL